MRIIKILDIRNKYLDIIKDRQGNIILNKSQTSLKSLLNMKLFRIKLNNLTLFALTTNKSQIKLEKTKNRQKLRDFRMLLMRERKIIIIKQIKLT